VTAANPYACLAAALWPPPGSSPLRSCPPESTPRCRTTALVTATGARAAAHGADQQCDPRPPHYSSTRRWRARGPDVRNVWRDVRSNVSSARAHSLAEAAQIDGYLRASAGTSVTLSNRWEVVPRRPSGDATSYGWAAPIQDVAARDIAAGDVVRLDDPQAQRVERAVHVDGRVVLELRPVGLEALETIRVTLPNDGLVSRLGTAAE
jgi:hypothetical protein